MPAPPNPDAVVLDLMSSWVSHLPQDRRYKEVIGHGLNAQELQRNKQLDRWFVRCAHAARRRWSAACAHVRRARRKLRRLRLCSAGALRMWQRAHPPEITSCFMCFPPPENTALAGT